MRRGDQKRAAKGGVAAIDQRVLGTGSQKCHRHGGNEGNAGERHENEAELAAHRLAPALCRPNRRGQQRGADSAGEIVKDDAIGKALVNPGQLDAGKPDDRRQQRRPFRLALVHAAKAGDPGAFAEQSDAIADFDRQDIRNETARRHKRKSDGTDGEAQRPHQIGRRLAIMPPGKEKHGSECDRFRTPDGQSRRDIKHDMRFSPTAARLRRRKGHGNACNGHIIAEEDGEFLKLRGKFCLRMELALYQHRLRFILPSPCSSEKRWTARIGSSGLLASGNQRLETLPQHLLSH